MEERREAGQWAVRLVNNPCVKAEFSERRSLSKFRAETDLPPPRPRSLLRSKFSPPGKGATIPGVANPRSRSESLEVALYPDPWIRLECPFEMLLPDLGELVATSTLRGVKESGDLYFYVIYPPGLNKEGSVYSIHIIGPPPADTSYSTRSREATTRARLLDGDNVPSVSLIPIPQRCMMTEAAGEKYDSAYNMDWSC